MLMALVAMVLVAAAVSNPIWNRPAGNSGYGFAALYLVPQALSIALPVGLAVGILAGTTRGKSSPWIRARLLAVALVDRIFQKAKRSAAVLTDDEIREEVAAD